jgi:hypothetical protein
LISDDAAFEKGCWPKQLSRPEKAIWSSLAFAQLALKRVMAIWKLPRRDDGPQALKSFVEKPDRATAEQYLAEGRYYWNSRYVSVSLPVLWLNNMATHASDIWAASEAAFAEAQEEGGGDALSRRELSSPSRIFQLIMR